MVAESRWENWTMSELHKLPHSETHFPQEGNRRITILAQKGGRARLVSFAGRWLAVHLDRETGSRYSLAQMADGSYVVIAKRDGDEAVVMYSYADISALRAADPPAAFVTVAITEIFRKADAHSRMRERGEPPPLKGWAS